MQVNKIITDKLEGKPLMALLLLIILDYVVEPLYNFLERKFFGKWSKKSQYSEFQEVNEVKEGQNNGS